jgi:hypothetical protein
MSGSREASQSYDHWSPAESWRAAEDRSHARRPAIRLPHVPARSLTYAACGFALALVALVGGRAVDLRHVLPGSSNRGAAAKPEPKTFAWVPARGARSYVVEFVGHGRAIYMARTKHARLKLPALWTYRGRQHALRPGVYHWYVWPIVRTAHGLHRGRASVSSKLTISG